MGGEQYQAIVPKELEDLIPGFLENRRKELDTLRSAVAAADFEQLRQLGHRMKGVGASYGFDHVSVLGKRIEESARRADGEALDACLAEYGDYLAHVRIAYG